MRRRRRDAGRACLWPCLLWAQVAADVYINHPRGSNNKMTEQNNAAQNQNRLFDSQNNANGGYQVYDKCVPNCLNGGTNDYDHEKPGSQEGHLYYYHGSELLIEWTSQHGCGSPATNTMCQIVLQYMCNSDVQPDKTKPGLRDGKDPDNQRRRRAGGDGNAQPQTANKEESDEPHRGRHEPFEYYDACRKRQRNKGLYTADQNLNNNLGAAATRQNNGGTRRGLECPEERDYYPYWHPTPWRDIAVYTTEARHCKFYQEESQNVKPKHICELKLEADAPATLPQEDQVPNNEAACVARGGVWAEKAAWDIPAPDCMGLPESRDNHHGNTLTGKMHSHLWHIPDTIPDGDRCAIRLRYNISSTDFDKAAGEDAEFDPFFQLDSAFNANPPLKGDPKDDFLGLGIQVSGPLQIQVNTAQFGRTFQDRTHSFLVKKRPSDVDQYRRIVNYGVRGRRGNIVQVYPAVEYDFVPQDLEVNAGDLIHFQWGGSDANNAGNAGNGRQCTDRSNLVQIASRGSNKPVPIEEHTLFHDFTGGDMNSDAGKEAQALVARMAFIDQHTFAKQEGNECPKTPQEAQTKNNNDDDNCQQLNAAPAYFDGGLVEMRVQGTFFIASTRNNDFSNRSQKAMIKVGMPHLAWWQVLLLVAGAGAFVLGVATLGVMTNNAMHALANPTSSAFSRKNRPVLLRLPCLRRAVRRKEEEREKFKEAMKNHYRSRQQSPSSAGARTIGSSLAPPGSPAAARGEGSSPIRNKDITSPGGMDGKIAVQKKARNGPFARMKRCVLWMMTGDPSGESDAKVVFLFYLGQVFCGAMGVYYNWNNGINKWFPVAKCGGYILDFNLSLLLIPTMRSVQRWCQQVRPLDTILNSDPIGFHIKVASWVAFGALVHIVGHVAHFYSVTSTAKYEVPLTPQQEIAGMYWYEYVFNPKNRFAFVTGVCITMMMSAMAITASVRVRRHTFDYGRRPQSCQELISWLLLFSAYVLLSPFWLLKRLAQGMFSCCIGGSRRLAQEDAKANKKVGGFLIFWDVHKCWMPCFLLLLIHGPECWIWFLFPLIFLACDRLVMHERRSQQIVLQSAELAKSKVIKLQFGIPPGFVYQAGMYVHICCDQINPEEWHPFTLTSCPEEKFLSVAIRAADELDWCSALRRKLVEDVVDTLSQGSAKAAPGTKVEYSPYMSRELRLVEGAPNAEGAASPQLVHGSQMLYARPDRVVVTDKDGKASKTLRRPPDAAPGAPAAAPPRQPSPKASKWSQQVKADLAEAKKGEEPAPGERESLTMGATQTLTDFLSAAVPRDAIRLRVDGPHGAPSELVWKHRVVMLVGAGIGVTPFASILKSLKYQVEQRNMMRSQGGSLGNTMTSNHSALRDVLNWEPCQSVHFYWLCRSQEEFAWFHDLLVDAVSGAASDRIEVNLFQTAEVEITKVAVLHKSFKQFMGRPNWRRIFPQVAERHPGEDVGCFLCGPQALRGELQRGAAMVMGSDQHGTKFTVHAENF